MLKGISKFFGTTFLGLGLILFLSVFFVSGLIENVDDIKPGINDVVKASLREYGFDNMIKDNPGVSQAIEACKFAPGVKECSKIDELKQDPGLLLDLPESKAQFEQFSGQFDEITGMIKGYNDKVKLAKIIAIVLVILGLVLIYLGTLELVLFGISAGFTIASASLLSFVFYKYLFIYILDAAKNTIIPTKSGIEGVLIKNAYNYIVGFFNAMLDKTAMISLALFIITMVLAVICVIIKKKRFKKQDKK